MARDLYQTIPEVGKQARTRRCSAHPADAPGGLSSESSSESESTEAGEYADEIFFSVRCDDTLETVEPVEMDIVQEKCAALRQALRERSCLPLKSDGRRMTYEDVSSAIILPTYSCPYKDCISQTEDRCFFLHQVAGGATDPTRLILIYQILGKGISVR